MKIVNLALNASEDFSLDTYGLTPKEAVDSVTSNPESEQLVLNQLLAGNVIGNTDIGVKFFKRENVFISSVFTGDYDWSDEEMTIEDISLQILMAFAEGELIEVLD
jgi:hypothetical protein